MWSTAPIVGEYLDGVCTSGLWEARLASEFYDGEITTYCAAYKPEDLPEILRLSDHVIFNSPGQIERLWPIIENARASGEAFDIGLRINPLHAEGEVPRYDPCAPHSRLGFPIDQLTEDHIGLVDGLHMHTLCEQDFAPLARTWDKAFDYLEPWFGELKWLNLGGGHHVTRADYQREELIEFLADVADDTGAQVYIEPGEAVALDAGILVGTILDTGWNGMPVAITDISATCHMPDVIEAPYRPAMLGEVGPPADDIIGEGDGRVRLGGPSCLAGDVIGDYVLPLPAEPGARFAFLDQAHYSMVKTTTFNGVPLPSIWLWDSESDALECVRRFAYEDFRDRLS
jgi:carboxynorspermidine decarboxylase